MNNLLRRGRALAVAAVGGLAMAVLVLPQPATARQPQPTDDHAGPGYWQQVQPTGSDSELLWVEAEGDWPRTEKYGACDENERDHLAETGAEHAVCIETGLRSDEATEYLNGLLAAGDASTMDNVPFPEWCLDPEFVGIWRWTRTNVCRATDGLLTVVHQQTGAVIATVLFLEIAYLYTDYNIPNWAFQVEIRPMAMTGTAAGTRVSGISSGCSGGCSTLDWDFPSQPVIVGSAAEGSAYFTTTVPTSGPVGYATDNYWTYHFQNPGWVGGQSTPGTVSTPGRVRCDTVASASIGCVIPDYEPTHFVSLASTRSYAIHIAEAQFSGLPGSRLEGPLHRLTDDPSIKANRDTACPPSWPRPSGLSCDEYPFASTWEGAYLGAGGAGGRTFAFCYLTQLPTGVTGPGYSSCMISENDNSLGGSLLGAFYHAERVLDEDGFFVEVVP